MVQSLNTIQKQFQRYCFPRAIYPMSLLIDNPDLALPLLHPPPPIASGFWQRVRSGSGPGPGLILWRLRICPGCSSGAPGSPIQYITRVRHPPVSESSPRSRVLGYCTSCRRRRRLGGGPSHCPGIRNWCFSRCSGKQPLLRKKINTHLLPNDIDSPASTNMISWKLIHQATLLSTTCS